MDDKPFQTQTPLAAPSTALLRHERIVGVLSLVLCAGYLYLLLGDIGSYWFDSRWSTDDACQQIFPFHALLHPKIFVGDLIYETMRGYLAPLHYALGALFTYLTNSPIMAGHWLMLIQLGTSSLFVFLAVQYCCRLPGRSWWYAAAPAFFALLWFLHSRQLLQRMTAGLPRGWAPVIFSAYLYFVLKRNHPAVMITLALGCLLNPPASFLGCAAYGLYLLVQSVRRSTRAEFKKPLLLFILVAPLLGALTLYVTARPASIGKVALLAEARTMPEFQKAGGRFSFLPFPTVAEDLLGNSFRVFISKLWKVPKKLKGAVVAAATLLILLCLFAAYRRREEVIPLPLLIFGGSSVGVYLVSRPLAFLLYVPDRYLTYPLGLFFILSLSIGLWRMTTASSPSFLRAYFGAGALGFVALMVYAGHGAGLNSTGKGTANFNYNDLTRGPVYNWIRDNTPETALFAGQPTFLDPIQLYGVRKGFVTSETWHPFYALYNVEMKRRLEVTFRAHYARDAQEFVKLLQAEGIAYFIFERRMFRPQELQEASYFEPLNSLVRQLTQGDSETYLFHTLLKADTKVAPYVDQRALVVNVAELAATLDGR